MNISKFDRNELGRSPGSLSVVKIGFDLKTSSFNGNNLDDSVLSLGILLKKHNVGVSVSSQGVGHSNLDEGQ